MRRAIPNELIPAAAARADAEDRRLDALHVERRKPDPLAHYSTQALELLQEQVAEKDALLRKACNAIRSTRSEIWRLLETRGFTPQVAREWPEIVDADAALAAILNHLNHLGSKEPLEPNWRKLERKVGPATVTLFYDYGTPDEGRAWQGSTALINGHHVLLSDLDKAVSQWPHDIDAALEREARGVEA